VPCLIPCSGSSTRTLRLCQMFGDWSASALISRGTRSLHSSTPIRSGCTRRIRSFTCIAEGTFAHIQKLTLRYLLAFGASDDTGTAKVSMMLSIALSKLS
jgi:hypothetical protein